MSVRSILDKELTKIDDDILKLASMVENALEMAMNALPTRDNTLAQQVILGDREINQLRYAIEAECFRVLATQQPAAADLRHVITCIHIATEFERIGDHASGIATLVERLTEKPDNETLYQLPKMAKRAKKMIRRSVQAFVSRDVELAKNVLERDEKLDQQYSQFFSAIMDEAMQSETPNFMRPTYLLWIGHNLERIGDRVTNIAERVIFMLTGQYLEVDPLG